jgi:hypothetical protein
MAIGKQKTWSSTMKMGYGPSILLSDSIPRRGGRIK